MLSQRLEQQHHLVLIQYLHRKTPMRYLLIVFAFSFLNSVNAQERYQSEVKSASIEFIRSLDPIQKRRAMLSFDDTARLQWNNLPIGLRARAGIPIEKMSDSQRVLLHRILSASLSSQGYLKATSIFHLDNLLMNYYDSLYAQQKIEKRMFDFVKTLQWSHKNFYLAFFGSPADPRWGLKLEGHHLSLNFSFAGNELAVTPFFIGTDPAEYPINEYAGWRVLGQEEDLGIKLIKSLTAAQDKKAIIGKEAPGDIFTGAETGKRRLDYQGLKVSEMTKEQKQLVEQIIREYVFNMDYDKAITEYDKIIKAGIENIYFAWIGPKDEKIPHYFMLNGPTFLIEFDNNGFAGQANHIHTIWREKGNEFGEDVLRKHYSENHKIQK